MRKSQSHDFETDVPASELWEVYGTLRAAELLPELLPQVLSKVELVSGDGGLGTILELTFPPGEILKPLWVLMLVMVLLRTNCMLLTRNSWHGQV